MTKKNDIESENGLKVKKEGEIEIEYVSAPKTKKKSESKPDEKEKTKKKDPNVSLLKAEVAKYKEECLRQMAEKENLRKRLDREKEEFFRYSLSGFMKEFLVILDNFERALESHKNTECPDLKEGIQMIYKQLLDVLEKNGLQLIKIEDKKFDPQFHQAFVTEESEEVKESIVSEEFQKGYKLHERLLRPTLVKVTTPKKDNS